MLIRQTQTLNVYVIHWKVTKVYRFLAINNITVNANLCQFDGSAVYNVLNELKLLLWSEKHRCRRKQQLYQRLV